MTIPLAAYLGAWLLGTVLLVWLALKMLKTLAPDGRTPLLFAHLRAMPKQEMLMTFGMVLILVTAPPYIWRTYVLGLEVGPASSEWLLFITGLLAINGATYVGKLHAERKPHDAHPDAG